MTSLLAARSPIMSILPTTHSPAIRFLPGQLGALLLLVAQACGTTAEFDEVSSGESGAWLEEPEADTQLMPSPQEPIEEDPARPIVQTPDEPMMDQDPSRPSMPPEPRPAHDLSSCELEMRWWNPSLSQQLQGSDFGWSPDQSVILGAGTQVLSSWQMARGRDGEQMLYDSWPMQIIDVDRAWRRALVRKQLEGGEQVLAVILLETGEELMRLDDSPYPGYDLALSEDGETLVGSRCDSHQDGTSTETLSFWSAGSGTWITGYEEQRDEECSWVSAFTSNMAMNDDASVVALVRDIDPYRLFEEEQEVLPGRTVHVFNRHGDHLIRRGLQLDDVPAGPPGGRGSYAVSLAGLEVHPDQRTVSVVDLTGKHYLIDTTGEDLAITAREERGAFVSNWNSYLPSIATSPMAWSADHELFASVNTAGEMEIEAWPSRGVVKHVLRAPDVPESRDHFFPEGSINAPVDVAFSPDNRSVMVAFTLGVGVWGCAGEETFAEVEVGPLQVELETDVLVSGQSYDFDRLEFMQESVTKRRHARVLRVVVDGEVKQLSNMSSGLEPKLTLYTAGEHEVSFEVDDGVNLWRSERQVLTVLSPR